MLLSSLLLLLPPLLLLQSLLLLLVPPVLLLLLLLLSFVVVGSCCCCRRDCFFGFSPSVGVCILRIRVSPTFYFSECRIHRTAPHRTSHQSWPPFLHSCSARALDRNHRRACALQGQHLPHPGAVHGGRASFSPQQSGEWSYEGRGDNLGGYCKSTG